MSVVLRRQTTRWTLLCKYPLVRNFPIGRLHLQFRNWLREEKRLTVKVGVPMQVEVLESGVFTGAGVAHVTQEGFAVILI
ncbi:hypothetical protein N7453_004849 [Penicillium expansum]|nr:hypothetical protein N7453_004849 [Penicillium expansum]